jgi:hypothetical protein
LGDGKKMCERKWGNLKKGMGCWWWGKGGRNEEMRKGKMGFVKKKLQSLIGRRLWNTGKYVIIERLF